jgi:hypothetical protein
MPGQSVHILLFLFRPYHNNIQRLYLVRNTIPVPTYNITDRRMTVYNNKRCGYATSVDGDE